jgi:hypothetical protein
LAADVEHSSEQKSTALHGLVRDGDTLLPSGLKALLQWLSMRAF